MASSAQDEIDLRLAEATELANAQRFDDAIDIIERVRSAHPTVSRVLGVLGATLYRARRLDDAVDFLRAATAAAPLKELPSVTLFHCLWDLGLQSDARAELVRFLRHGESELYRELLSDLGWEFDRGTGALTVSTVRSS